jgi:hypothetical protein
MALTKTKRLIRCDVSPVPDGTNPQIIVLYDHIFEDPDDNELPLVAPTTKILEATDADGNATDVSQEDLLVQTVCSAVWT